MKQPDQEQFAYTQAAQAHNASFPLQKKSYSFLVEENY